MDNLKKQDIVLDAARFARMAYATPQQVQQIYESTKQTERPSDAETFEALRKATSAPVFLNDPASDAQGYGLTYNSNHGNVIVIAMRGTSSLADSVTDAEVRLVPLQTPVVPVVPDVYVHDGFLRQYLALEKSILDFLNKFAESDGEVFSVPAHDSAESNQDVPDSLPDQIVAVLPEQKSNRFRGSLPRQSLSISNTSVLFCGHSMGAANAAIAALCIKLIYDVEVRYVGFGCPLVGNSAWATKFRNSIRDRLLIKCGRDPVTKLPLPIVYQQIQEGVHIGRADPYPNIPVLTDLPDHDMSKYILSLRNGNSSEKPTTWVPYLFGLVINTPVKMYQNLMSWTFYTPF